MDFIHNLLNTASGEVNFFRDYQILIGVVLIPAMLILKNVCIRLYAAFKTVMFLNVQVDEANNISGYMYYAIGKLISEHRVKFITKNYELSNTGNIRLGTGFNVFKFQGAMFFINSSRREGKGWNNEPMGTGTISFFRWNLEKFHALAHELAVIEDKSNPVMAHAEGGHFNIIMDLPLRLAKQYQYIDSKTYNYIDMVFKRFVENKSSYEEFCQAYKETFMLYGPPGTGKTNLARHFAAKYGMDLFIISATSISKTMFNPRRTLSTGGRRLTIYLIEDIDSNSSLCKDATTDSLTKDILAEVAGKAKNAPNGELQPADPSSSASFYADDLSTFLNVLDGAIPLDGCIVMISSNYPGKLYKSIYRLGRIDHRVNVNYMSFNEVTKYMNWTADNPVYQFMLTQPMRDALPANAINRLRFAKDVEEAKQILEDVESAQEMANVIC